MSYNQEFEDTMDNINNIAYGYGYKNGIEWANIAQKSGEISWSQYKKYENAHNLRVRFSHGNARDIAVSYETYSLVREWEDNIYYSKLRKSRNNNTKPKLPAGTFRNRPFIKEFNMNGEGGRNYYFRFEIVFEYQERAYDDGTYFKGKGYTIYVKSAPYKEWCIDHNSEYEFHYYNLPYYNPSICWNRLITDFQDANAVMMIWVKRYCKILDQLFKNGYLDTSFVDKKTRRRILPSGTFRNKKKSPSSQKRKKIYIDQKVYKEIMSILGTKKPELGGMLGWKADQDYIDYFIFDENAIVANNEYNPNTKYLSSIINGEWENKRIFLAGFVHSHPRDCNMLSNADIEYAQRIMTEFDLEYIFMPIITSSYGNNKSSFNPYIVTKNGHVKRCDLVFTKKEESNETISEDLLFRMKEIEKEFEKMSNVKPIYDVKKTDGNEDIFSRISNVIDIDHMKSCSIIGIGCGGSRGFYESMARVGVSNFFLMDGDKSSYSNIASQNGYISDVGKYKPDIIKAKLLDINPNVNVEVFNCMLTNELDDLYLETKILSKVDFTKTVLCAFTDDFYAQARISRIALKYKIPFICGQHHEGGVISEIIFWYPGVTKYSLREIAKSRYEEYKNGYKNKVTSFGSPIFNTTRLNGLCEKITTGLLLYNKYPNHIFSLFIEEKREMNLILIKQQMLEKNYYLYDLFVNDLNSCFDEVAWINPESLEDLSEVELEETSIVDTRDIFK